MRSGRGNWSNANDARGIRVDVGADLGLKGRRDHLSGPTRASHPSATPPCRPALSRRSHLPTLWASGSYALQARQSEHSMTPISAADQSRPEVPLDLAKRNAFLGHGLPVPDGD